MGLLPSLEITEDLEEVKLVPVQKWKAEGRWSLCQLLPAYAP